MPVVYPDGLAERHAGRRALLHRHANPISFLVLGGLLALALTGLLGGARSTPIAVSTPAATLIVKTPEVLRSGLFFETDIAVTAHRPIADAVIALPPGLWLDQTVNTQVPAASEEEYADGAFRFHYGPLAAGQRLVVKVDGQVNPPLTLGTKGAVTVLDGDRPLAAVPLSIKVLP